MIARLRLNTSGKLKRHSSEDSFRSTTYGAGRDTKETPGVAPHPGKWTEPLQILAHQWGALEPPLSPNGAMASLFFDLNAN